MYNNSLSLKTIKSHLVLACFLAFFLALTVNDAFPALKPTEADARNLYESGWVHAAKKKFFNVIDVKKVEGQISTFNGVQFYKMHVDVMLQSIWGVVVCQRSNPFDNSTDSLHVMRDGEYKKISDEERAVFTGHNLGSIASCKPKVYGEQEKITLRRILVYEEFESGWRLSNSNEALQLKLKEQYLVGEEADAEIAKMPGMQGVVTRGIIRAFADTKVTGTGQTANGAVIFKKQCAPCHGDEGRGTYVAPAFVSNAFIETGMDADIATVIRNGRYGTAKQYKQFALAMPAQRSLSNDELNDIIAYLKHIAVR